MKLGKFIPVLAAAALLSGCCMLLDEPEEPVIQEIINKHQALANRDQELSLFTGKAWVTVFVKGQDGPDGKNTIELPPEQQAYIEFHKDGKVNGFAGVNKFNGTFVVIAPNQLRFGALATTSMSGPHLDYEMLFLAQINEVDNFKFKDGKLELYQRSTLMMTCKPVAVATVEGNAAKVKHTTPAPPEPTRGAVAPAAKPAAAKLLVPVKQDDLGHLTRDKDKDKSKDKRKDKAAADQQ